MSRTVDLRKKIRKKETLSTAEKVPLVKQEMREKIQPATAEISLLPEKTDRFEWEAPSFYYNPQKKYLAWIIIALLAGAGAIIFYRMDALTAIFLILSSVVMALYVNKKPMASKVVVNQAGVMIDNHAYFYKELKSFWLDYNPNGPKELSLEARKWYMPYVKISIENQNPVKLRSLMVKFIAEKEHEKSLVDLISRKMGL